MYLEDPLFEDLPADWQEAVTLLARRIADHIDEQVYQSYARKAQPDG